MWQVVCGCEKPVIDKRLQYAIVTTFHDGKTTKEKVENPVQYCVKCGGAITTGNIKPLTEKQQKVKDITEHINKNY